MGGWGFPFQQHPSITPSGDDLVNSSIGEAKAAAPAAPFGRRMHWVPPLIAGACCFCFLGMKRVDDGMMTSGWILAKGGEVHGKSGVESKVVSWIRMDKAFGIMIETKL